MALEKNLLDQHGIEVEDAICSYIISPMLKRFPLYAKIPPGLTVTGFVSPPEWHSLREIRPCASPCATCRLSIEECHPSSKKKTKRKREAPSMVHLYREGGRYEDTTDQKTQCRSCKSGYTAHWPYALDGNTTIPGSIRLGHDI